MKETENLFSASILYLLKIKTWKEKIIRLIKNSEYGIGKKILVNISFFNMKLIPEKKMESFQDGTWITVSFTVSLENWISRTPDSRRCFRTLAL